MEIKITIDSANFGGTVEELFRSLSTEQKQVIATDLVKQFLLEPYDLERKAKEQSVIDDFVARNLELRVDYTRNYAKNLTGEQIRRSDEFKTEMGKFVGVRDKMVKDITTAAIIAFDREITNLVRTDPQIQQVKEATVATVKEAFPGYVQNATVNWFSQYMASIITGVNGAGWTAINNEATLKMLGERLSNGGMQRY